MKKNLIWVCVLWVALMSGCGRQKKPAILIGDIPFTAGEFERAFADSRFADMGEPGRKEFLEDFISTRLILKEAEGKGLDKDPQFLRDIQNYWQQGLLKLMLTQKTRELAAKTTVSDDDVEDYYIQHKDSDFAGKTFQSVYPQVRWLLMQERQRRMMAAWMESLRSRTKVTVNDQMLHISP